MKKFRALSIVAIMPILMATCSPTGSVDNGRVVRVTSIGVNCATSTGVHVSQYNSLCGQAKAVGPVYAIEYQSGSVRKCPGGDFITRKSDCR